jgi:hypothetical protein
VIRAGLAAQVRALPEVAAVSGAITDTARLIGKDGALISTRDQAIGINVDTSEPRFNPLNSPTAAGGRRARDRHRRRHRRRLRLRGRR